MIDQIGVVSTFSTVGASVEYPNHGAFRSRSQDDFPSFAPAINLSFCINRQTYVLHCLHLHLVAEHSRL